MIACREVRSGSLQRSRVAAFNVVTGSADPQTPADECDSSGGGDNTTQEATNFTDEQIQMLVRNTEQFGCGLVMLGGENSYGVGGYFRTAAEQYIGKMNPAGNALVFATYLGGGLQSDRITGMASYYTAKVKVERA